MASQTPISPEVQPQAVTNGSERRCKHCGGPIPEGKRKDAKFCTDACRQKEYWASEEADNFHEITTRHLNSMNAELEARGFKQRAIKVNFSGFEHES